MRDRRPRSMRISTSRAVPAARCRPAVRRSWSGTLIVPVAGDYDIDLQLLGATGKFGIDGKLIGRMGWWGGHGDIVFANRDNVMPDHRWSRQPAPAREIRRRRARHHGRGRRPTAAVMQVQVRLAWVTPEMKAARVRRCHRGGAHLQSRRRLRVEPQSPGFGLPGEQDRLIAEVAAVNPEHHRRAQHRTSRRDALAQGRPCRARDVVHGR